MGRLVVWSWVGERGTVDELVGVSGGSTAVNTSYLLKQDQDEDEYIRIEYSFMDKGEAKSTRLWAGWDWRLSSSTFDISQPPPSNAFHDYHGHLASLSSLSASHTAIPDLASYERIITSS